MPTLKARIGGAWVPVAGGSDEVSIGPNDPGDTTTELWYDTDEPNLYEPDTSRWNTAWGIVGVGTFSAGQGAGWVAGSFITNPLTLTLVNGRRYRVNCVARAVSSTSSVAFSLQLWDNGVAQSEDEWVQILNVGFNRVKMESLRVGDGAAHTFLFKPVGGFAAGTVAGYPTWFYVEDVGPVSLSSNPPAQPPSVWTAVTYQNGWTDFDSARTVRYRMLGDMVQIQGLMKGGTAAVGTPAFVLPVGYRPRADVQFIVAASPTSGINNVWVNNVGVVSTAAIGAGTANGYVYLDAVAFPVTP